MHAYPNILILVFLISIVFIPCSALANGADEALRDEIRRLEARIAALEDTERASTFDGQRSDAIRALIFEILHDADSRASLLDQPITAGHDGRFFIADSERRFRLNISTQVQVRFVHNRQSSGPHDDHRNGFELRRIETAFFGHAFDPRLRYKVQGAFDQNTGAFKLLDAEIGWMFSDDWFVRAGQFRPGFVREDSVSSTALMTVEQSLVNERLAQNRMQGIELRGLVFERFRISGMVSDGLRSRNTPWELPTVEYALTGRAEWLAAGTWNQFRQFTSPIGEQWGLLFGGAIHWQRDEFGTVANELEILRWTLDGQLSLGGASVFAAFIGSHEDQRGGGNFFRYGLVVQGAVYVADPCEVFVRYEYGDVDEGVDPRLSVITAGVNWYFDGHRLKWTNDVGVGLKPVSAGWAATSAGWRTDAPGENRQVVLRSQLQLLF